MTPEGEYRGVASVCHLVVLCLLAIHLSMA